VFRSRRALLNRNALASKSATSSAFPQFDARLFSFSASESNPEEIEPQETRTNTGFSTFGRIGGRPKETEKERPEGPFWGAKRGEKGVSRPKVCDGGKGANDAISSQNPPLGEAGFQRQRMFR